MPIEHREGVDVITHPLARQTLTRLRDRETDRAAFRRGLVDLGHVCGYELVGHRFESEPTPVRTPLTETTGERVAGLSETVVVTVLRAAVPFVEGVLGVIPSARQGMVSAGRNEAAGMDSRGQFPVAIEYVNLPDLDGSTPVIVADPMLATGSTMVTVLEELVDAGADPTATVVLSAVAARDGVDRVTASFPGVDVLTVSVDDHLDGDGFIVPGLGDAGDRAFGTL